MVTFDRVTKVYSLGNTALDNVSLAVEEGEFLFLVGPSGAGKTTLLELIYNRIKPTSGTVIVDQFDVSNKKFNQQTRLRKMIGIVFQDFKILNYKSVFENIALSLEVENLPQKIIKEKVSEALRLVGLENKENYFPRQLSAGEVQRIVIARATTGQRKIILADEPTGNLDPKTSWEIMKIFKKIEKKKTIIIATHNTDIVDSLQKRVIYLQKGKIKKDIRKGGYSL